MKLLRLIILACLLSAQLFAGTAYRRILIVEPAHPAVHSAAQILARKLSLPQSSIQLVKSLGGRRPGDIVLTINPEAAKRDGYRISFDHDCALVQGVRPRSLLYAAGDVDLWKDERSATYVREPSFAVRSGQYTEGRTVAEYVAEMGVNIIVDQQNRQVVTLKETFPEVYNELSPADKVKLDAARANSIEKIRKFARECHDADVPFYQFLYGNDITLWSPVLYQAALKAYPSIKGVPVASSWEKAYLCPSDPITWKLIKAYVQELLDQSGADGMYATFWDRYGIYCQDDRCRRDGLNTFPNELYKNVQAYYDVLHPRGKKLVVRTWSSGVPHWLGNQFVHAPGYGNFGGTKEELWSRVIHDLPSDIVIQSKVYYSDCQPDARFNPFLGKAKPHTEIAEYQEAGQTLGRFYFPASSVNYIAATMRKSFERIGADGGVNIFPGGTHQSNYSVLDDILNSVNLYIWRQLSWNINTDVQKAWMDWAVPIYGTKAAPHVVKALQLSEDAVNRTFSTLGMGSDTNSSFAPTIQRRETLLKYTNRYYLPEYAKFLEPTKENIRRVHEQRVAVLKEIDEMLAELEQARPYLTRDQADELTTRFQWLKEYAICSRYLDESLWRYRYLLHLSTMLTTDPGQLKPLAEAYREVRLQAARLFQFDPGQKFSCYDRPLGELRIRPSLGSPMPLMREIYERSEALMKDSVGPNYPAFQEQQDISEDLGEGR